MFNYEAFKASYIEPTKLDYIKFLMEIPSFDDARAWSHFRMSGGPMTESEYQGYLTITDDMAWNKQNADDINRLRCLTTSGHYLKAWLHFFVRLFRMSFEDYKNSHYENAVDAAIYMENSF